MKGIIKDLKAKIKSYLEEKEEVDEKVIELQKALDRANKQLLQISKEIRESGGIKKFRNSMRIEAKKLRNALRIQYRESKWKLISAVTGIIVIVLFLCYNMVIGLMVTFSKIFKGKRGRKNENNKA
jgi:hypothetical protein